MSGIIGSLLSGVLGQGGATASPLNSILQEVMSTPDAQGQTGVAAIMSRFQASGLGAQAQSWLGSGANMPITADHIEQAFSPDQIAAWSEKTGATPDTIKQMLAEALPHAVDHVSPDGQVPAQGSDLTGMLEGFAGNWLRSRMG